MVVTCGGGNVAVVEVVVLVPCYPLMVMYDRKKLIQNELFFCGDG